MVTEASTKPSLEMPPHAIAGLTGELAKKFERQAQVPLVQPVAHVWTTKGKRDDSQESRSVLLQLVAAMRNGETSNC